MTKQGLRSPKRSSNTTLRSIITSFTKSLDDGVIAHLKRAGYDNATATKLVTEFPGLDLFDLADGLTRAQQAVSGLTESAIAERVAEFGKHVEVLHTKKRNKKPPQASLVHDFEVGVALLAALAKSFRLEFGRSAASASSTFTGSGWYGDSDLGGLSRLTSQLRIVSLGLHRLTEIAQEFHTKDVLHDFENLQATTDSEYQTFENQNRTTALCQLWSHWCVGYSLPGRFITASQTDEDRFAPWRYIPWVAYFQRALYFYLAADGKTASHVYLAADGKQWKQGRTKKLLTASWEAIQKRMESSLPENVDDDERSLFTTKPSPRRRSTVSRTPEDELVLRNSDLLARRAVKVWRCGSCSREVQPFDTSHQSMSKYDSYICPTWHNCGGILRPIFDDN